MRENDGAKRRQELSKPIVEALRQWLEAQLEQLSSSSDLTRCIRYGLKRWNGMTAFLSDGRLEMVTNAVKNATRPIPLRRTNALFEAVEYATLEWVDWFNNRRLLEPIGNIPPAEAEANFYADLERSDIAA